MFWGYVDSYNQWETQKIVLKTDLYDNELDNRPSFSDAMVQYMKQEVDKIKEEAIKWHQKHKNDAK